MPEVFPYEVEAIMTATGMDKLQAYRHVQMRKYMVRTTRRGGPSDLRGWVQ